MWCDFTFRAIEWLFKHRSILADWLFSRHFLINVMVVLRNVGAVNFRVRMIIPSCVHCLVPVTNVQKALSQSVMSYVAVQVCWAFNNHTTLQGVWATCDIMAMIVVWGILVVSILQVLIKVWSWLILHYLGIFLNMISLSKLGRQRRFLWPCLESLFALKISQRRFNVLVIWCRRTHL